MHDERDDDDRGGDPAELWTADVLEPASLGGELLVEAEERAEVAHQSDLHARAGNAMRGAAGSAAMVP